MKKKKIKVTFHIINFFGQKHLPTKFPSIAFDFNPFNLFSLSSQWPIAIAFSAYSSTVGLFLFSHFRNIGNYGSNLTFVRENSPLAHIMNAKRKSKYERKEKVTEKFRFFTT